MTASIENQQDKKRILVLGSVPHARQVTAYSWDNLPDGLNVADYEVVILNFVPLRDEEFAKAAKQKNFPDKAQFCRHLFREEGELIAIGTPRHLFATWWLPIQPSFVYERGESIREIDPNFGYYFQRVRRWSFHTGAETQWETERRIDEGNIGSCLDAIHPKSTHISLRLSPIAKTGFGQPIAFRLRLTALKSGANKESSPNIFWLPPTTEISDYEAVDMILRERYGLFFEQVRPEWVDAYQLPKQIPIETEIDLYREQIQEFTKKLEEAERHLQEETRFHKMLYTTGEDVLEPVVRDALRELGATARTHK